MHLRSTPTRLLAVLGLAVLPATALSACDHDAANAKRAAAAKCPALIGKTAGQQPPQDVPRPSGASGAYSYLAQGKTKYYYFALPGSAGALTHDRDSYDSTLKAAGYSIDGTDQESGIEAESDFKGHHEGHTRWRNLCQGHVQLQLQLND